MACAPKLNEPLRTTLSGSFAPASNSIPRHCWGCHAEPRLCTDHAKLRRQAHARRCCCGSTIARSACGELSRSEMNVR